jgi:AAA domain/DnaB-like helicase N terminal domain
VPISADDLRRKLAQQRAAKQTPQKPPPKAQAPRQPAKDQDALPDLPQIEQAVLQVIFANADAGFSAFEHSARKSFFVNPVNRELYNIARAFHQEQGQLDWIAFTSHLTKLGRFEELGGHRYITDLFVPPAVPPFDVLPYYIKELSENYVRRQLTIRSFALGNKAKSKTEDIAKLLNDAASSIEDLRRAGGSPNGSERFDFAELMAFDSTRDPNCLVGNRYLVRGGSSLWAGGSGYGKSSLELQLAVYWGCGVPCFGLRPVRPLKSLIIQAENDKGDMSEQLQGVIAGIDAAGDLDVQARRELIEKNLGIHRAIGQSGAAFLGLLESLIEIDRPDFIWIDPLFAFAGVDLMNAAVTGRFIRDGLFPIAAKHMVALNVIHHVGKPVRDPSSKKADAGMAEIDFQYLGFGTSEVQNAFRAVNILVPVGNTGKFRLVLSKRGERAGAKNTEGEWCRSIYLEHAKQGICWLQCEKPEKPTKPAPNLKYTGEDIREEMSVVKGWPAKALQEHMKNECGMSEKTFYRLWKDLKKSGEIKLDADENWIKI